eukprot:CAMPEP_0194550370 /NCGR_PEP_ID=MMETSP0253-20130528/95677_1 /TAXON_ID=2966 /ORGANISM="Noctiluca scintillans" /LENGTH=354 /DNA_ID=CAMNT_0039397809 /DNA_START=410 /DNA_END=1474 /DNA_ORIENTATION=+
MTLTVFSHLVKIVSAYREKKTVAVLRYMTFPEYLSERREIANALVGVCLVVMLSLEPIIHCWGYGQDNDMMFTTDCDGIGDVKFVYSVFSALAMFLYLLELIDLTVFSNKISAYVLVCNRMLSELALFLLALAVTIVMFASAVSTLKHEEVDFKNIFDGSLSFFTLCLGMASVVTYRKIEAEAVVFACVGVFILGTSFFLLNLLIAQLTCAYDAIFDDMVGYARLGRIGIIVETMTKVPSSTWDSFVGSLRLDKPCEFVAGDLGVSGGLQVLEPASAHTINVDMIGRFGGSTSATQPWPAESEDDDNDRIERMEKVILRSLKRRKKGGSAGVGGSVASGSHSQTCSEDTSGRDD